ncbi:MAG: ABC transporter ATP-binding protein [Synechococcus sp. ELA057]
MPPACPLEIKGLRFGWGSGDPVLPGCDLTLPGPGLWMLVGSNGSGKSTLLRLIAGLLTPDGGSIRAGGRVALVFQNPDHQLLLPSCASDLLLSLPPQLPAAERRHRVEQSLAQVGLAGFANRPIHTLSGGQKQRLAIAGALASEADLLLLDEPTALLDPDSQREVLALIRSLCPQQSGRLAALWITHRLEELEQCDGAARMERGRVGPWRSGARLRRQLHPLPSGGAQG